MPFQKGCSSDCGTKAENHIFSPEEKKELKKQIDQYRFTPLIDQLVDKEKITEEEALKDFNDLKQFLYLCITAQGAAVIAPPPKIDALWHRFILFSREYAKFCKRYNGSFIHHDPHTKGTKSLSHDAIAETIKMAQDEFNELSKNWAP